MIRVLHVVENFNGQAVESWLTRVVTFEGFDPELLSFDFFLLGVGAGKDAGLVSRKGCALHPGNPGGASIPRMARALRRVVQGGNYDIVHIHQDVMAGVFSLALVGTGVRLVTHVHNCWQRLPVGGVAKERILTALARRLALSRSDAVVGVSRQALSAMTRGSRRAARIDRVIYCSAKGVSEVNPGNQGGAGTGSDLRSFCQLSADAKVLLFLGRLDDYKNPLFAVEILKCLVEGGDGRVHLVIAGVGGLAESLRQTAERMGLGGRLHLTGWLDDPDMALRGADLLLMPSSEVCGEGLGLAAVEAQAGGLPVLASLSIPEDAGIVPGLLERMSLQTGASAWAAAANRLLNAGRADLGFSSDCLAESPFTDSVSYSSLLALYKILEAA